VRVRARVPPSIAGRLEAFSDSRRSGGGGRAGRAPPASLLEAWDGLEGRAVQAGAGEGWGAGEGGQQGWMQTEALEEEEQQQRAVVAA
jgi:hypothetical protein